MLFSYYDEFCRQLVHLEMTILRRVTQTQKDMHVCTHLQVNNNHKVQDKQTTLHSPKEVK